MPSTRDIRRRIKSVKSTAQVTKAMQMVASSKMTKAQQGALAGRPYAQANEAPCWARSPPTRWISPTRSWSGARGAGPR